MDDRTIVQLYWDRSESAIAETDKKYGAYCHSIAHNILNNAEDAGECVNDTWLAAWRAMPPKKPAILSTFLGKITRRLSIDRWRSRNAAKRGSGELPLALEELRECADTDTPEKVLERKELAARFNRFLQSLPETERSIFLCRYWYLDSIGQIAKVFGFTQSKVTSILHRTRKKLKEMLQKEGYV